MTESKIPVYSAGLLLATILISGCGESSAKVDTALENVNQCVRLESYSDSTGLKHQSVRNTCDIAVNVAGYSPIKDDFSYEFTLESQSEKDQQETGPNLIACPAPSVPRLKPDDSLSVEMYVATCS